MTGDEPRMLALDPSLKISALIIALAKKGLIEAADISAAFEDLMTVHRARGDLPIAERLAALQSEINKQPREPFAVICGGLAQNGEERCPKQ
jgi:hypothetical protein